MSGPSPITTASNSSSTSRTSSAARLPAAGVGSAARRGNVSGSSSYYSSQPDRTSGYVSPYPPLPPSCTQSAARQITATTRMVRRPGTRAPQSISATLRAQPQEDVENVREYTFPTSPMRRFQLPSFETLLDARTITQAQKQALVRALNDHRINTLGELRRVERIFATLGSSDLTQPMTAAWVYYVNSNSLLTEFRGLTRNYPFCSELLEEGKRRVHQDPASNRSWNYCWLVLAKIHTDGLIPTYARVQASRPDMWGGREPPAEGVDRLAEAFVQEWNAALAQLLRYWEAPPIR